MNPKNQFVMVALCAMSLVGCMTAEEYALYRKEQETKMAERRKEQGIKMVEGCNDDDSLVRIVWGISYKGSVWKNCDYEESVRLLAFNKLRSANSVFRCGLVSAKVEHNRPKYRLRQYTDAFYQEAIKRLSTFTGEELFRSGVEVDRTNLACDIGGGDELFREETSLKGEALVRQKGQEGLYKLLANYNLGDEEMQKYCAKITDMDDKLIAALIKRHYQCRKKSVATLFSKLKGKECKIDAVKYIVCQKVDDENYDFTFEKDLIVKHRAEIIEMFGDDASLYPKESNLARFASLLYTDEERKAKRATVLAQRGTFNGVFGKKFGDVMPTDEGVRVTKFGADFYRVPFEPAKKSEAFTHYYVWLTPSSHKIFEIEARSDSALAFSRTEVEYKDKEGNAQKYQRNAAKPDVVFALEKKYCEYFMKQGEAYVLQFPEEKCHLSIIPNLAGAIAGGGRSGFVDLFMMNTFGFTADHEQEEKKIRRLKDYNFSSVEEKTRALVFAESAELYKLAKEETNAERTKQKKAAADKQKAAAQNAADAF